MLAGFALFALVLRHASFSKTNDLFVTDMRDLSSRTFQRIQRLSPHWHDRSNAGVAHPAALTRSVGHGYFRQHVSIEPRSYDHRPDWDSACFTYVHPLAGILVDVFSLFFVNLTVALSSKYVASALKEANAYDGNINRQIADTLNCSAGPELWR